MKPGIRQFLADAAKPIRVLMESTLGKRSDGISLRVDWMNAHILLKEPEVVIGASENEGMKETQRKAPRIWRIQRILKIIQCRRRKSCVS